MKILESFKHHIRLYKYFFKFKTRIIIGLVATLIMGLMDTVLAAGTGILMNIMTELGKLSSTDNISFYVTVPRTNIPIHVTGFITIIYVALVIFVSVLIKVSFVYLREYMMNSAAQKVLLHLRNEIFSKILRLPMSFFDKERTGNLMSRITSDVGNVEVALNSGILTTQNFIYTVIFTIALFITSWKLTLLTIVLFPILGVVLKLFGDRIRAYSKKLSINVADITSFLQENISSIKVIKSFVREDLREKQFYEKVRTNYYYSMKNVRAVALLKPINEVLSNLSMIIVIFFCAYEFVSGNMKIDTITTFIVLVTMLYKPLKELGNQTTIFQKALASAMRIFEILDLKEEEEVENPVKIEVENIKGEVEFRNVYFKYESSNEYILNNISFKVKSGKTLALVGASGSGKTTIVNLIPRFYKVERGEITIDGININQIHKEDLRKLVGLVPQETVLFADTIFENIRLGKLDATEEEIYEAAKFANAYDFIMELPDGFNTYVGERGTQLSGGQRQRIAIARAILSNPKILLLDEATSALDNESEHIVQEALDRLMKTRTSIVVAHRLSTIQNADQIIVLDKGEIVETGTHQELLQKNGFYYKYYHMQFREKI
ncbi:MAG TPA: ABC transporter ATP-binding protein [Ignavibacteriales bacterium]|nr:ABC transporter ATP-binding protein [Ignavibacteriales bacterium]HOM65387.1 ABC transporter ATP-binding protein [Ignavibacteriales bacterium]HPP33584.1 ABC transporter ATP-binding protein [Ignavibacteriales bacterium]